MPHLFRAKSFIANASADDDSAASSMAGLVENYLEANDTGGIAQDIDEVICTASCKLNGDRIFTLVVIEDQTAGG